jgi:hypothetical protein
MNEPRRLREECESSLERALLDAGTSYRSSKATRERTLAALGLAGSAALSAAAIGTASSSAFAKVGWVKALALASTVGAVAAVPAGYLAWRHSQEVPTVAAAPKRASAAAPGPLGHAIRREESIAVPARAPEMAPLALPAGSPAARAPKAEPKVSSADLSAELAAIEPARYALASGDASGALSRLDAYSRTYPRGRLALEAEVLRIDALARSGQRDAAKKRAEAFVRRYPNSVLKARVRAYLGE